MATKKSKEQFENTISTIKEIEFDQVNTAAYSPRPNTPAALWTNQLPEAVKVERLRELNSVVEKNAHKRNKRYLNSFEEVLVEGVNSKDESQLMGRTRTNRLTFFPSKSPNGFIYKPGDQVDVLIKEIRPFSLSGIILNQQNYLPKL